jgi:hypothetical protein
MRIKAKVLNSSCQAVGLACALVVSVAADMDVTPPSVSLTAPSAWETFMSGQSFTVKATASDNVSVSKIWFIRDGVVVSTDTVAPYEFNWSITVSTKGPQEWSATAFDTVGNSSTTLPVPVMVYRVPSIVESGSIERYESLLPDAPQGLGHRCSDRTEWGDISGDARFSSKKASVIAVANNYVGVQFPPWEDDKYKEYSINGKRDAGEKMLNARRAWVSPLTLAYCLTGEDEYLVALSTALDGLLDQRTWVFPALDDNLDNFNQRRFRVDLAAAGTAHEIAQAIYLLDGVLDPSIKAKALKVMDRKIFQPILYTLNNNEPINNTWHWWLNSRTNWNAVGLKGLTGSALALLPSKRERALFAAIGHQFAQNYVRGFPDDGYSSEGMGYWSYGFQNFAELRAILFESSRQNMALDLFRLFPKVENIALFPINFEMDQNVFANFGDSIATAWDRTTMAYVLDALNRPQIQNATMLRGNHNVSWDALTFSRDSINVPTGPENRPLFHHFNDSGVLVSRTDPALKSTMAITIKGSERGVGHEHHDIGSYAISLGGVPFIGEPGGHTSYSADTFGPNRFKFNLLNSWGHPVPVVAGQRQNGAKPIADNVTVSSDTQTLEMTVNMEPAYNTSTDLNSLVRRMRHDRMTSEVVIEDRFTASSAIDFQDAFILKGTWTWVASGNDSDTFIVQRINPLYTKMTFNKGTESFFLNITADRPFSLSTETFTEVGVTITRFAIQLNEQKSEGSVRMAIQRTAAIPPLANPGFEEAVEAGRPGAPAGWSLSGAPKPERTTEASAYKSGVAGLKIGHGGSTTGYKIAQQLWTGYQSSMTYQLSFWGKVVSTAPDFRGAVDVRSADNWRSVAWTSVGEPEWTKYSMTFSTDAAEPGLSVRCYRSTTSIPGWVYLDDFSISTVTRPTAPPNPPSDVAMGNMTSNSFDLSWAAATGGALRDGFRVDVSTMASFAVRLPEWAGRMVGDRTAVTVRGVEAGKMYYARVWAYNGVGGNSAQISTSATTPPAIPESLTAAGMTNALDLTWTGGGSNLAGYRVDVSTDMGFGSFVGGWQGRDVGLTVSTRAAGLAASTTYHARVRAVDFAGNVSGFSVTASTRTSNATAFSAAWSPARGNVVPAGDGRTYRESTEVGWHYAHARSTAGFSTSDLLRFSVLIKPTVSPGRGMWVSFYNTDVSTNRVSAYGTLGGAGSVRSTSSGAATQVFGSLTPQPDGWYLCTVAGKLDESNHPKLTFIIGALSGTAESYAGDPAAGFDFKNPEVTVFRNGSAANGATTSRTSATAGIDSPPTGVEGARAYPVPYRSNSGAPGITFDRLPEGALIRIFTLGGRLVRTLSADGSGRVLWGLDNGEGSPVPSGVYVVEVENGGNRKVMKVIVER